MKIGVLGGGSTYTPELVDGLLERARALGVDEIALMDIDAARLECVGRFCQRMAARAGGGVRVTLTPAGPAAIEGAAFVVTQIRVGGQEARRRDERLGMRHGLIGQETTGVGGFAKALRTIPAILGYAEELARRAPAAWLINFTNPSGLVTEAILTRTGARAIGLCNIPLGFRLEIAKAVGVTPAEVELDYVGLNHLAWIRRVRVRGADVTAQVLAAGRRNGPANFEALDYPDWWVDALGMIPNDYLRYFYLEPEMAEQQRAKPRTRAEEVMEVERELLAYYADPAHDEKPAALAKRGGAFYSRAACELMAALASEVPAVQIVDVRNGGAVPDLPPGAVVEVPCRIDRTGAHPLPVGPLPPEIRGLMAHVKAYEELAVRAGADRDRRAALLALVAHPLVPSITVAQAVLDELLAENGLAYR
ncbi:MAG TPA: 6-phospho-beta-glucosidase [Polyangia bacterium]